MYFVTAYEKGAPDLFRVDLSVAGWPSKVESVMKVSIVPNSPSDFCFFPSPNPETGDLEENLLITFQWLQSRNKGGKIPATGSQ